jgi:hypothetical protein
MVTLSCLSHNSWKSNIFHKPSLMPPLKRHMDITTLLLNCKSRSFLLSQPSWLPPAEPVESMWAQSSRESTSYSLTALGPGSRKLLNCYKPQFYHLWNVHEQYLTGKFWRQNEIISGKCMQAAIDPTNTNYAAFSVLPTYTGYPDSCSHSQFVAWI